MSLPRTRAALERGIEQGLHAGASLCAVRRGEPIELALGLAPDAIVFWFSSTKPLMSAAIGQLVERGLVDVDDPVARHVPEFAANGKAAITLRHLLTHTAGIPHAHRDWSRENWDEIVAKICAAAPEPGWKIGEDCGYHVASAWYVLGEIVRRRDGRGYDRYVREAIFAPLGLADFWVGMGAEDFAANRARIAPFLDATRGAPRPARYWAWTGSAESVAICRPGGSGWGTARALAGFYAALLQGDSPILRADTVRRLTAPALSAPDRNLGGIRLDRGLGVVLNSAAHGPASAWYGNRASPLAFGHAGFYSSVAFADPAHDLAVALAWSCLAPPGEHDARVHAALDALYEDLGPQLLTG